MTENTQPAAQSVSFDRAASFYDATRGFPLGEEAAVAACVWAAGNLTATSRVLEIGVGTGRIALPVSARAGAIFGVDISLQMMARLRAKQAGASVYVTQADAARLPFPSGVFDAAVAVHVFHLIPNWTDALGELARVLRPSALLLQGWNDADDPLALDEFCRQHMPPRPAVGVPPEKYETFLDESGWRRCGAEHIHKYHVTQTPASAVERLKERSWASTFDLTDRELADLVRALEAHIAARASDFDAPFALASHFHVQAYAPPDGATPRSR